MDIIDNLNSRIELLPAECKNEGNNRLNRILIAVKRNQETRIWIRDLIKLLNLLKENGV